MAMLRKHVAANKGSAGRGNPVPSAEMEAFGWLFEFLFMTEWEEDKTARVPGTVLLFAEGVHLKAMLNDKDGARVAFGVLDPDLPVLEALDAMIGAQGTDWRPSRERKGSR